VRVCAYCTTKGRAARTEEKSRYSECTAADACVGMNWLWSENDGIVYEVRLNVEACRRVGSGEQMTLIQ